MTAPAGAAPAGNGADLGALALAAARAGAAAIATVTGAGALDVTSKSAGHDLVTAADKASEVAILDVLRQARPRDAILAEESGRHEGTSGVRWLVDPLDGTANFVYGRADWAVSVAAERNGVPAASAILRPTDGRWLAADGARLQLGRDAAASALPGSARPGPAAGGLSSPADVGEALVSFGLPYSLDRRRQALELVARLVPHLRGVRVIGSAACDYLALASGEVDASCTVELAEWDTAAGEAAVAAAGGSCVRVATASGLRVLVCGDRRTTRALADLVGGSGSSR